MAQDSLSVIQSIVPPDSSNLRARYVDEKVLRDLRSNSDFDYKQPPTVAESL
jgi:hypothetical protein